MTQSHIPFDAKDAIALVRRHLAYGMEIPSCSLTPTEERPMVNRSPTNAADLMTGGEAAIAYSVAKLFVRVCAPPQIKILIIEREPPGRFKSRRWNRWCVDYSDALAEVRDDIEDGLRRMRVRENNILGLPWEE